MKRSLKKSVLVCLLIASMIGSVLPVSAAIGDPFVVQGGQIARQGTGDNLVMYIGLSKSINLDESTFNVDDFTLKLYKEDPDSAIEIGINDMVAFSNTLVFDLQMYYMEPGHKDLYQFELSYHGDNNGDGNFDDEDLGNLSTILSIDSTDTIDDELEFFETTNIYYSASPIVTNISFNEVVRGDMTNTEIVIDYSNNLYVSGGATAEAKEPIPGDPYGDYDELKNYTFLMKLDDIQVETYRQRFKDNVVVLEVAQPIDELTKVEILYNRFISGAAGDILATVMKFDFEQVGNPPIGFALLPIQYRLMVRLNGQNHMFNLVKPDGSPLTSNENIYAHVIGNSQKRIKLDSLINGLVIIPRDMISDDDTGVFFTCDSFANTVLMPLLPWEDNVMINYYNSKFQNAALSGQVIDQAPPIPDLIPGGPATTLSPQTHVGFSPVGDSAVYLIDTDDSNMYKFAPLDGVNVSGEIVGFVTPHFYFSDVVAVDGSTNTLDFECNRSLVEIVAQEANNQLVSSFELGESKVVESGYNAKVLDAMAVNEEQENDFNYNDSRVARVDLSKLTADDIPEELRLTASTTTDDEDSDPGDTSKPADNTTTPANSTPSTSTPSNSSTTDSDTQDLEDEEVAEVLLTPINFVDISGWYKEYIDVLSMNDIMLGKTDDVFDPKGTLTRAEVVQVLYNLGNKMNIEVAVETVDPVETIDSPIVTEIVETMVNSQTPFEDIAKKDWYFESVNWAKDKGYILGYDNKFMPNEFISRQDFAMIVERYINDLEASGLTVNVDLIDGAKFSDSEMISAYALSSVERIQSLGLVNGNHNLEFMPKKEISRGEGAKVFSLVFGMFE